MITHFPRRGVLALAAFIILSLTACGAPSQPAATSTSPPALATMPPAVAVPTSTPYPPAIMALIDLRESAIADIETIRSLYNREDYDKAELDRGLRSLVPTVEAANAALEAEGVSLPPYPLPPTPALEVEATIYDTGLVTDDGVRLAATYYSPPQIEAPGLVLLHMLGAQRQDWRTLAQTLQSAGFGVLAIDLRGHGESEGRRDYVNMTRDAAVAIQFLRSREEIDGSRIALIGASIGANIALNAAAADGNVAAVALLSPGEDYRGVTTPDALQRYGARPLFIAASSEDSYAANSARTLDAAAAGPHELLMLSDQGHGTAMLGKENGLEEALLAWLQNVLAG